MISIKKTDYVYRITLPKNKDVNIVNVYNNLFFSIFPLKGLRVYKNEKQVVLTADAYLWRENLRIYEISDIVVGISETEQ